MRYAVCGIGILYALLSAFAAAVQMKSAEKKDTSLMMLGGALLFTVGAVMDILEAAYAWLLPAVGGILICAAAFLNGKRGEKFHASHHVIRLVITILFVAGFYIF